MLIPVEPSKENENQEKGWIEIEALTNKLNKLLKKRKNDKYALKPDGSGSGLYKVLEETEATRSDELNSWMHLQRHRVANSYES